VGIIVDSSVKPGSRKGRLNYPAEFKKQLAVAACVPGVSVARIALAHGINANMLHKWRRRHLAGEWSTTKAAPTAFLPVTLADSHHGMVVRPDPTPLRSPISLPATAARDGVIEIRCNNAVVRIDGVVDASVLDAVLRHFHS
jgi:transposase